MLWHSCCQADKRPVAVTETQCPAVSHASSDLLLTVLSPPLSPLQAGLVGLLGSLCGPPLTVPDCPAPDAEEGLGVRIVPNRWWDSVIDWRRPPRPLVSARAKDGRLESGRPVALIMPRTAALAATMRPADSKRTAGGPPAHDMRGLMSSRFRASDVVDPRSCPVVAPAVQGIGDLGA
jgi:hypothetical protein